MIETRKYPIGIQDFEKIRLGDYVYVDKSELVYRIVNTGCYYFLSRPRRFGKSLLLSTIGAYLEGKRELFEGLAIEQLENDWTRYPVLYLDLNIGKYDSADVLEKVLDDKLALWESKYGARTTETTLSLRFAGVIRRAYQQTSNRVVILVDEYDKPLLQVQAIGNKELQNEYRNTLKSFYSVLKSLDGCIKFAMLTGVTKFGKVSVFSDLNNLEDISMLEEYTELCGITKEELFVYFDNDIRVLASQQKMTYKDACDKLKEYYDGYHFEANTEGIYNPFSLLNTFKHKKFGSYWFETGTPTYLVELLKRSNYDLEQMSKEVTSSDVLNSIYGDDEPIPVIFQSGYLTIKDYDERFDVYQLGFPNREVEEGFVKYLLPYYSRYSKMESSFEIQQFVYELERGKIDSFFMRLQSFFADVPYELISDQERYYQNVLFIVFRLAGFYVNAEYRTSDGRIDLVLQTPDYIYVMEFELNGTAEEALQQIEDKKYALPFAADSRKLYKIGVNFSSVTRRIDTWVVK